MYGLFLLLLHPIFLAIPKIIFSVEDAMMFLVPFQTSTAVDFGIFSLLLFIILIGLTLFGVIFSYPTLKLAHKFLGIAFLLGAVHGFMIDSDISSDPLIRYWVLGLSGVAVLFYILHSFFKKFTVPKHLYSVMSVKQLEGQVTELALSPHGEGITHLPGQFAFFSFIDSKTVSKEPHPFTISSWMGNGDIVLSAKSLGDFSSLLSVQTVGELVQVEGPFGEFSYLYGSKSQVWVAGGIGVTPFVAMAEHILSQTELPYSIDFFYSVRTEADATYHEIFESVALKFPNFVYHPIPSDKEGYITGDVLVERVKGIIVKDIFICGPPPMMKALIASLTGLGIKKRRIHSELFSLLK
jgi:predicted ferric reductase